MKLKRKQTVSFPCERMKKNVIAHHIHLQILIIASISRLLEKLSDSKLSNVTSGVVNLHAIGSSFLSCVFMSNFFLHKIIISPWEIMSLSRIIEMWNNRKECDWGTANCHQSGIFAASLSRVNQLKEWVGKSKAQRDIAQWLPHGPFSGNELHAMRKSREEDNGNEKVYSALFSTFPLTVG